MNTATSTAGAITSEIDRPPGQSQVIDGCTDPADPFPLYTFTSATSAKMISVTTSMESRAYWMRAEISMPR